MNAVILNSITNIFDIWMNALNPYSDTYLALCLKDENIIKNIKIYCEKNNYDLNRIIFLKPIDHKDNLLEILYKIYFNLFSFLKFRNYIKYF